MSVFGDPAPHSNGRRASTEQSTVVEDLRGKKLLLVASTGGHLAQLDKISSFLDVDPESLWVTFNKPQSNSLMHGRRHEFIPYIAPRAFHRVARSWPRFHRIIKQERFDAIVSTGAAIALASHLPALARRVPVYYVESVSRFHGPSLTGRIMGVLPVKRLTQHAEWASAKWPYEFSVMDAYSAQPTDGDTPLRSVFVTLGTIKPYRFDSLVDSVVAALPPDVSVTWQLGETMRADLPGTVHGEMTAQDFERAARGADLVITHAGVGTVMQLLDFGTANVVVPRRKSRGEHVDDHQTQVAAELKNRGLATVLEADEISLPELERAQGLRAVAPARTPRGD